VNDTLEPQDCTISQPHNCTHLPADSFWLSLSGLLARFAFGLGRPILPQTQDIFCISHITRQDGLCTASQSRVNESHWL
jgi:hypothetical protein